jgi:lipopolysaccharide export system permease protein
MMVLAIPFAITSARAGGVGFKIVMGIMLGLASTSPGGSSRTGQLNDWPALLSAGCRCHPVARRWLVRGAAARGHAR